MIITISIDLSHINSSLITNMEGMFQGLTLLNYADLTNLDTSQVSTMS